MPTGQGWLVTLAAVAFVACGRLFGIEELYVLGAAAAALVIAAVVVVARLKLQLDIRREVHPPRVHAGTPARVTLDITNRARRRTPLLNLRDPVGEGRSATVVVAPLAAGDTVRATYRLPSDRRGVLQVGPLDVHAGDPFGLASTSTPGAPVVELTVWPRVDEVPPLPHTIGDDPHGGSDHPNALTGAGDDFYALRPYVVGDDLRHVHWKSTARRDELMVRQDEMPWQGRATILLDTRADAHDEHTFERAVSGTASVVVACAKRRYLVRLLTTGGDDSGFGAGQAHTELLLERLAVVDVDDAGSLARALALLRRSHGGGAVALLLGGLAGDSARRLPRATVVVFGEEEVPFPVLWRNALDDRLVGVR